MPELPEVEIVTRRLDSGLSGARVESAVAPGMNVMKTFEPPLEELVGREVTAVRRVGKMPVVEFGDLALLIHLMSAGRLRAFDRRASLRDRSSRVLIRLEDGRELRLRELGTKQRAWAKLLTVNAVAEDEMVATVGPEAWPPPPLEEFAGLIDQPRHLHPLLRDQRVIAGIGRSWVDEILWEARLSPFRKGSELNEEDGMRKRSIAVVAATSAIALVSVLGGVANGAPKATIKLGDNFFNPTEKSVTSGTKVRFRWTGGNRHNVTKNSGPGGGFSSRTTRANGVNFAKVFTKTGTYRLICTIHPAAMRLKLTVR
jgi:formamidopyrimidine-DNA glycosylase